MGRQRNTLEMSMDILRALATSPPQRKTHILRRCNLEYKTFLRIFDLLLKGKFIQPFQTERGYFEITGEGIALVKQYAKLFVFMDDLAKLAPQELPTFRDLIVV